MPCNARTQEWLISPLMRKLVMIDTEVPPALLPLSDVRSLTPLPLSRRHGVIM